LLGAEDMDLDAWLAEHIGCEQRRADVRANVDCLSDFRVASLEDLEDALGLAAWPALPKKRFLDAWRRLKDGEDEAAPSSEPQRPRSAPVSAAELAAAARGPPEDDEEDDEDEEEDVSGRAPSRSGRGAKPKPCEVRRVGDKKWRRFASRSDAAAAFPDLRGATMVGKLIRDNPRKTPRHRAPADIRERFEARNVGGESRSAPVSAARGARDSDSDDEEESDEDEDEDFGGRAPSRSGKPRACEIRRVGDKKWRRFASLTDAVAAFPGLRDKRTVGRLITDNPRDRAPADIRKRFEARDVGDDAPRRPRSPPISAAALAAAARGPPDSDDDDDDDDDAPTTKRTPNGQMACEIRRAGAKKWRRFASRKDGAAAFTGLHPADVTRLINDPATARDAVRGKFEARNAGDASPRGSPTARAADSDSDDEEDDDEQGATRGKILEMRRVGDASWRKFASQVDAARAFGLSNTSVSRLIKKTSDAPSSRFEARMVDGDIADVEDVSQIEVHVVAVGDRVELDGESGVVTSIGENQHRGWKVRLDGEDEARNCHRSQITKDGSPVAAPAPVPVADDADDDDDDPRPPAPPRTFALPSLPADACELRRVGDADWRRFASRADAARAFGGGYGLDAEQIGKLIDDSPVKPSRDRPKRTVREEFEARAALDNGAPFEAVPLEDECVICQKSTLEADDTPMQDVLLCDVCEGDVHLACTSLSKMPGDDDPFTCAACAAAQGNDAAPESMDTTPPAPAPAADDFDELYSEVAAAAPAAAVAAAAPAPAAADDEDWGSASFGMSKTAPAPTAPAPAPVPPIAAPADDEAPPAKRARLDDLLGPPPAEEAPAPAIPNDGSFIATMKQALAAAPAPPVLQPIAPPPSMTPTNGGVLQPIVLAPSSPAPPPPAQPSSPASWPTLSDFDKSRVEALSHSCPAAAGRLAEALSRRAPAAPASPAAPAAQPAPPGTPDAKFQEAVAML
jgi:hypothetical protein